MPIPFIDIFAGPGGLGEGFSAFQDGGGSYKFRSALSIEKDERAHETLLLRSFLRQFRHQGSEFPKEYYDCLRKIPFDSTQVYEKYPEEYSRAYEEAQCIELGGKGQKNSEGNIDRLIENAVGEDEFWGLLGGPPCQAYSVIGRSRMGVEEASDDPRTELYRHYLRILAVHQPAFFIFENVRGISSSTKKGKNIFEKICGDLRYPCRAVRKPKLEEKPHYQLFAFAGDAPESRVESLEDPNVFLIKSELFQIPQRRHRVIIFGIRDGLSDQVPNKLEEKAEVSLKRTLAGLPELRSGISSGLNSDADWKSFIFDIVRALPKNDVKLPPQMAKLSKEEEVVVPKFGRGAEFVSLNSISFKHPLDDWFLDPKIGGVLNHSTRAHLADDLYRYLFCSAYANKHKFSPKLKDFPKSFMPKHKSAGTGNFDDRFRVQLADKPSTTITSHISKDGHYFIHPDSRQCRSLTVREAARIQTFPDNYFFCGPRTSQYVQVGNAVPPLLARQMAAVVYEWAKRASLVV